MVNLCAIGDPGSRPVNGADSAGSCLDPPPGELAEPITLRDKLACVWKQLLAAPSQNETVTSVYAAGWRVAWAASRSSSISRSAVACGSAAASRATWSAKVG